MPNKPREPRDPERDEERELIAAEIRRSYGALLEESRSTGASIEADLAERLRELK